MESSSHQFTATNAVYHAIKGLIFEQDGLAYQITKIFAESNDETKKALNEQRLKQRLFLKIQDSYKNRINKYGLDLVRLADARISDLQIIYYKVNQQSGGDDSDRDIIGGKYKIFPSSFACKKCGFLKVIKNVESEKKIDLRKCDRLGCDGTYEQISVMHHCKDCGNVRQLEWSCGGDEHHPVKLERSNKDSLSTYRVSCQQPGCSKGRYKQRVDIFRFQCEHKDPMNLDHCLLPGKEKGEMRPLTVTEGSIFLPVNYNQIDIPNTSDIDLDDLEYILLGLYLGSIKRALEGKVPTVDLTTIQKNIKSYKDEQLKTQLTYALPNFQGLDTDAIEHEWQALWKIPLINEAIAELKAKYTDLDRIQELNDFSCLTGEFGSEKEQHPIIYEEYLDGIEDPVKKDFKRKKYDKIKETFSIDNIIFVPSVRIIQSCYGIINGVNAFYDPGFVPHFEPIWSGYKSRDKFEAYAHGYKTEGIAFVINKHRICEWLKANSFIEDVPSTEEETFDFFANLDITHPAFKPVKTILHTLSHMLIRRSSLYTGLDEMSCSEILFPPAAAFFIYSTNTINIGGFQYVFENELHSWFDDIIFDAEECTVDPSCIMEKGACFACMYLPEFVCSNFNYDLDRDAFVGKAGRFPSGFWVHP